MPIASEIGTLNAGRADACISIYLGTTLLPTIPPTLKTDVIVETIPTDWLQDTLRSAT